jgi:hypothetical protein
LIIRAAAAEISAEMAESWMTLATIGICRSAKSRKPVSTAEKQSSETTVEIAVNPATILNADCSLPPTPNAARRQIGGRDVVVASNGPAMSSAR